MFSFRNVQCIKDNVFRMQRYGGDVIHIGRVFKKWKESFLDFLSPPPSPPDKPFIFSRSYFATWIFMILPIFFFFLVSRSLWTPSNLTRWSLTLPFHFLKILSFYQKKMTKPYWKKYWKFFFCTLSYISIGQGSFSCLAFFYFHWSI